MRKAIIALLLTACGASAQLRTKPAMTLEAAKTAAAAAGAVARANTWSIAIAILDDGAHLVYFERMDGVQIAGIDVAMRKAESAVKYKRPTKAFADRAVAEPQSIILPGSFPFEGGVPIVAGGEVIGGVGVTGAAPAQDAQLAKLIADAISGRRAK